MAKLFPIFDKLSNLCKINPDIYIISEDMRVTISTLNNNHIEIISLLILHYSLLDNINNGYDFNNALRMTEPKIGTKPKNHKNKNKKLYLPYKGSTSDNGKGIFYNIDNYPPFLEKIIAAYIKEIII